MKSAEPADGFDAVTTEAPLVACVSAMQRFCIAARVVECLLLGASAGCLVLGAAAWSGSTVLSPQAIVAAFLGAAAAAATWWLTDPRDRVAVARLVDRRCELQGAVITAYEREISGDRRPLSRELSKRTVAKIDMGELRRSMLQRRVGLLAVPCISFALWTIAVDQAAQRSPERDVAGLLASIADRAGDLENAVSRHAASERIDARSTSEVTKLARLARSARDESHATSARVLENVRALQQELEQVTARIPRSEDLQRSVSRVTASVDAARVKLEGRASSPASAPDRAESAHTAESDTPSPSRDLADTTSRAHVPTIPATAPSSTAASRIAPEQDAQDRRDEAGVVGGMWWSARYDSVVERWVEMQRTSRNASR